MKAPTIQPTGFGFLIQGGDNPSKRVSSIVVKKYEISVRFTEFQDELLEQGQ